MDGQNVVGVESGSSSQYSGSMDAIEPSPSSLRKTLSKLLATLSPPWLSLALDLLVHLGQTITQNQPRGMYEMLEYDARLELLDSSGILATFSKRQRVRFLQDNIIAYQDFVWGNGRISEYRCAPGHVADSYQEGDRRHILLSLRETKNRGDVEEFHIQYRIHGGFVQEEEWWQVEIRNPTRRLKIAIVFPPERRCQRALLLQRSRHRSTSLDASHFSDLPDGRQILRWETEKIGGYDLYTIRWWW